MNELLALSLAKKENVMEIVDFYGAKLKGRSAYICMEFMPGEKKNNLCQRFSWYESLTAWLQFSSQIEFEEV